MNVDVYDVQSVNPVDLQSCFIYHKDHIGNSWEEVASSALTELNPSSNVGLFKLEKKKSKTLD